MDYVHLGRSGLLVSRLCLGTVMFGPVVAEAEAHRLMDRALDLGINFLDTSNSYGRHAGKGRSEEIIGSWFALGGGRRERTVLATKFYEAMSEQPNESGLSALHLRRALDESLRRLQTDHVDLYQFHHVDRFTPWEEIWQAVEVAIQQGKVLYVGSSNFAAWHIAQAQEAAVLRQSFGLVSEQSLYNLVARDVERDVVPAVQHYGLGLLPWSPLHEGLLGGIVRDGRQGLRRLGGRAADALVTRRDALLDFEALSSGLGHEPAEVALAWLLHQPAVTAPVIGPRTEEQLASTIRALEIGLEPSVLSRLDELFPGEATASAP